MRIPRLTTYMMAMALCLGMFPSAGSLQGEVPKTTAPTPALKSAYEAEAKAVADAEAEYVKALVVAKQKLAAVLEAETKAAMANGDLDTANKLAAEKKRVAADIAALTESEKPPVRMTVAAIRGWQPTSMRVKAGQVLNISATGTWKMSKNWTSGAEGLTVADKLPTVATQPRRVGRLIARVGTQTWYPAETPLVTVAADGVLEFRPEDRDDGMNDNSGELRVEIRTVRPEKSEK